MSEHATIELWVGGRSAVGSGGADARRREGPAALRSSLGGDGLYCALRP